VGSCEAGGGVEVSAAGRNASALPTGPVSAAVRTLVLSAAAVPPATSTPASVSAATPAERFTSDTSSGITVGPAYL
jgi:hypothetical protein